MPENTTPESILDSLSKELELSIWYGEQYINHPFSHHSFSDDSATLVGYFNLIHSNQAQVLGKVESNYLQSLGNQEKHKAYQRLFGSDTIAIFFTDGLMPPIELKTFVDQYKIPVFCSSLSSTEIITHLRYFLSRALADKVILHGVFMEVISLGVMLTGESGLGKSELALELVTRGHRLIADDAPEFMRIAPDIVVGSCPLLLRDFLEVRGLGVLNIREMYGDSSIKFSKYLRLIIHLTAMQSIPKSEDRLATPQLTKNVLGLEIPVIRLPVAAGRNLAVMTEAAVRNHLLMIKGYSAADDFIDRQQKSIQQDSL
ncbi:MAG: HPr(Ser) kinase/phosphatase [Gammaproteobacteria bacterium]|nr:HPr(Ser) kinase/phosphatase [Gammaproteobacteria bacterium]